MSELSALQLQGIPQEMIHDIATGVENPFDIAFRYGFSATEFKRLMEYKPFALAVEKKKVELETSGFTARTKAVLMADPLMDKVFKMAMADQATFGQVMDAMREMTRLGDLVPKQTASNANAGPGFSIQINIPQYNAPAEKIVIDAKSTLDLPDFSDETAKVVPPERSGGSDPVGEAG